MLDPIIPVLCIAPYAFFLSRTPIADKDRFFSFFLFLAFCGGLMLLGFRAAQGGGSPQLMRVRILYYFIYDYACLFKGKSSTDPYCSPACVSIVLLG